MHQPPPCPLCGSTGHRRIGDQLGWFVFKCGSCGFQFAHCSHADRSVAATYDAGYFDPLLDRDAQPEWRTFYETTLDRLASVVPGRRILDAGSGTSCFAAIAKEHGWQARVVDGSAHAVEFLRHRHGLQGSAGDLNDREVLSNACGGCGSVDAVNSFHVIEHLRAPRAYLLGCHDVLVAGGILRLGLPIYPYRRIRRHELAYRLGLLNHPFNFGLPDHVSFFDKTTICELLRQVGFDVLSAERSGFATLYGIARAAAPGHWLRNAARRAVLACKPVTSRISTSFHLEILARKAAGDSASSMMACAARPPAPSRDRVGQAPPETACETTVTAPG